MHYSSHLNVQSTQLSADVSDAPLQEGSLLEVPFTCRGGIR